MWAMMGECTGGALRLQTGERFSTKRCWHKFNGAETPHRVEAFYGERLSVVLFTAKQKGTPVDWIVDDCDGGCDCGEQPEKVVMIKKSYRNVGKREKQ